MAGLCHAIQSHRHWLASKVRRSSRPFYLVYMDRKVIFSSVRFFAFKYVTD
jgi:hypothetical protein